MVYIMFHISAERVRQPRPHYNKIKLLISSRSFFFFNDTATTEIYPFPLHDALPILVLSPAVNCPPEAIKFVSELAALLGLKLHFTDPAEHDGIIASMESLPLLMQLALFQTANGRSEEHTSELQSHSDLVCRLLLEKK